MAERSIRSLQTRCVAPEIKARPPQSNDLQTIEMERHVAAVELAVHRGRCAENIGPLTGTLSQHPKKSQRANGSAKMRLQHITTQEKCRLRRMSPKSFG